MKKLFIIDLIRVFAAFSVVLLHVGARLENLNVLEVGSGNWWVNYFYNMSQFWAVPIFFMVSGGLLLKNDNSENIFVFYKKRLNKVLVPLIFWTIVYFIIRYFLFGLTLKNIFGSVVKGAPYYHLWFFYALLGLYIITPFIRRMMNGLSKYELIILIGISLFVTISYGLIHTFVNKDTNNVTPFFSSFLLYLGYYLFGYYVLNYKPKIDSRILLGIVILITLFISLGGAYATVRFNFPGGYFASYLSPFTILQSSALFVLFIKYANFQPSRGVHLWVTSISTFTLGIYLIHPALIELFKPIFLSPLFYQNTLITVPLFSFLLFFLSLGIGFLIQKVPYLRRII